MNDSRSPLMPKARTEQLIIKELPDETLVYDLNADKAHCLNQTASLVWKYCDGKTSVSEMRASLAYETGASIDERVIWLALEQLEKFQLLANVPSASGLFPGLNRRDLIRTMGMTAAALPVIMTMSAPTAQAQASCRPKNFQPCTPTTNCCSGLGNCNPGTGDCK